MSERQAIRLAEHREELAAMGAGSLSLFGSVARDEAGPDSDIDILIDLRQSLDLFDLGGIQVRREEIMGCRVDLVMPDTLRPRLRARVLGEAIHVSQRSDDPPSALTGHSSSAPSLIGRPV